MLRRLFSKNPKVQCVAAHLYIDKIILVAQNQVKYGYWIYSDHYEVLQPTIDNDSLGEKIRLLATHSKKGGRNPVTKEDFNEIEKKLLVAGNFKTQKASRQCKYCNIQIEDDLIKIAPTINEGSKGHHYFETEFNIKNNVSNLKLGNAIRSGWEKCK